MFSRKRRKKVICVFRGLSKSNGIFILFLHFTVQGFGSLNGAELGFVYSVPEKNFLVLFNRLKLEV